MNKTTIATFSLLIFILLALYFFVYPKLEIVSGYNAKILCSCEFVSGISQEKAEAEDLGFSLLWLASNKVDREQKIVKSSVLGMHPKTAVYRKGLGCTLVNDEDYSAFASINLSIETSDYAPEIWPSQEIPGTQAMQVAINLAFDEDSDNPVYRTRAVVVIKNGELVGERYAEGFNKESKLLGWSMTKSVTSTLAGILAKRGFWRLSEPMPIGSWRNDDRREITLKNALQQTVGLNWDEDYANVSTATIMLYRENNMGAYAASQPLESEPGTVFEYSSGTSNIIAGSMRQAFDGVEEYLNFPYNALFKPIGARNFVIETDATNHFVGSSYGYAPARDWAKLGLLYLNQGNWFGTQIIDSTWVKESVTAVPESDGEYGYQFWLNQGGKFDNYSSDSYWMNGYQGQQVSVHPADSLVVVRIGVTYDQRDFPFDDWMKEIKTAAKEL